MRRIIACSTLAVLALFMLIGCSTSAVKKTDYSLRYPSFPQEPRYAYLRSYYGAGEPEYLGFLEKIMGAPGKSDVLEKPMMAVSQGNILYAATNGDKSISMIDMVNNKFASIMFLSTASSYYNLKFPVGLAVSAAGYIYIVDGMARVVYMTDQTGFVKSVIGEGKLVDPFSIALDEKNEKMYVTDRGANAVHIFSMTGDFLSTLGGTGEDDGKFKYPQGIAVDKRNGNLVVGDTENFRIQVFDAKGNFLRKWGEAGDSAVNFARIASVAIDSEGHVYVTDVFKHTVLIFDEEGKSLMNIGRRGIDPGFFSIPMGISIDDQDRIYVADLLNGRVQVFQYLSDTWKKDHPEEYQKYLEKPVISEKPAEKRRKVQIRH